MAFDKIYKGEFTNTQVDYADNSADGQDVTVKIYDRAYSRVANPYGIVFSAIEGNLYVTVNFTITGNLDGVTGYNVQSSDDGGITWTTVHTATTGLNDPVTLLLPLPTMVSYQYLFVFTVPPDEETVYIEENVIIPLDMAENPVGISIIDNDENKFSPIRAKRAEIVVHTSPEVNITTFSGGGDNDYYVEISVNGEENIVFSGWLSISDLRQVFQDHPNELILTATDGIGFLKDIPFSDLGFVNENKLIDYIYECLLQTGLDLNLICEFNVREIDSVDVEDGHFYNTMYVNAFTFEGDSCFDVLEKILKQYCELSQQKNKWFIRAIDEIENGTRYFTEFADGAWYRNFTASYNKQIGSDNSLYTLAFMNDDAQVSLLRPCKYVQHIFRFETPDELPCNNNFERGNFIGQPDPTGEPEWTTYELDCWTLKSGAPPFGVNNNEAFISRKEYDDPTENERYAEITFPTYVGGNASFIESQPMYVNKDDKFTFNYDFRWSSDFNDGTINIIMCSVRLEADNGAIYFLAEDGEWYLSDATWSTNYKLLVQSWDSDTVDETEWRSLDYGGSDPGKIPLSGKLYFMIHWENVSDLQGISLNIKDFTFDYLPYINKSYTFYNGQSHKTEQAGGYKASIEEDIYITDSPSRLFKGTLMKLSGGEFVLTEGFYNAAVFPTGEPAAEFIKPFGEMQNLAVWNQINRTFSFFEGTIDGIDTNKTDGDGLIDMPDLIHTFEIKDSDGTTNNKKFMLLHYDQDLFNCENEVVLAEVYDTTRSKTYTGHEFKYTEK